MSRLPDHDPGDGATIDAFALSDAIGWRSVTTLVERLSGLDALRGVYAGRPRDCDAAGFVRYALESLQLRYRADGDVARIPDAGPLIVVANHPHGAADGLLLADLLLRRRRDVLLLANQWLQRIPELRPLLAPVDVFRPHASTPGLRSALAHLAAGGVLVVFPAGEVSRMSLRAPGIRDRPWARAVSGLAARSGAAVLPVHIGGRAPLASLAAGLLHSRLRTALLARDLLARRGTETTLTLGHVVSHDDLCALPDVQRIAYLRWLVENLGAPPPASVRRAAHAPVAAPADRAALASEVAALPGDALLCRAGEFAVYVATAAQAPAMLDEIARVRELSFRAVGEGTGRAYDRDAFDAHYEHLFLWHAGERQVVGAYRLGATVPILASAGPAGLYTSTLFRIDPRFYERLGPSLELGRSFVHPDWQKSYRPLQLLWGGIAAWLDRHPDIRHLFGPVSISAGYSAASRRLIAAALTLHRSPDGLERYVRPLRPLRGDRAARGAHHVAAALAEPALLSRTVARLERGPGIPVLLRQYLELGGRFAAFSVDPEFADALDGLVIVEVARVPQALRARLRRLAAAPERAA